MDRNDLSPGLGKFVISFGPTLANLLCSPVKCLTLGFSLHLRLCILRGALQELQGKVREWGGQGKRGTPSAFWDSLASSPRRALNPWLCPEGGLCNQPPGQAALRSQPRFVPIVSSSPFPRWSCCISRPVLQAPGMKSNLCYFATN